MVLSQRRQRKDNHPPQRIILIPTISRYNFLHENCHPRPAYARGRGAQLWPESDFEIPFDSNGFLQTARQSALRRNFRQCRINSRDWLPSSRGNTTGPRSEPLRVFNSGKNGKFMREIGKNLRLISFAHAIPWIGRR